MSEEIFLSVIIPAYNEEKRLPRTLDAIDSYLRRQQYLYEILVVNDGSKDGTSGAVKALMSKIQNLRLVDNKENHGKGYVVRQGMLEAKGKYRLFTDADNSTSIDQVETMLPFFEQGFDVVIGSRDVKGAALDQPQPWLRRVVLGEGFKLVRKIIIGLWGIQDTQCGFKALTKRAAEDTLPKCSINRWAFDPEILVAAGKAGYKTKEIPVRWKNDLESKVKLSGMIKMIFELLAIRLNSLRGQYDKADEK